MENRKRKLCDLNCIEHETHFLFHCNTYINERESLFNRLTYIIPNLTDVCDEMKLKLQTNRSSVSCNLLANYIHTIFKIRKNIVYRLTM